MIKWFAYIVTLLIFAPCESSAHTNTNVFYKISDSLSVVVLVNKMTADTVAEKNGKKPPQDDKVKIKEVTKTKKQPKPEKVGPLDNASPAQTKQKHKRQRRPEGLERPPEIPRRNGN
jgi:hypothetical protein